MSGRASGERPVVYADSFTPDVERRRAAEVGEAPGAIPFLKRFTVFNTDQCDGLPEGVVGSVVPPPAGQIEPRAEALIAETGADFRIGGARLLQHDGRFRAGATARRVLRTDQSASHGLPRAFA
jgi:antirestriction protein ArdC